MKIKILIPVYNDWQSLSKLLENINLEISKLGHEFSAVIINDGSTDPTPNNFININNTLVEEGYAVEYWGGKKKK